MSLNAPSQCAGSAPSQLLSSPAVLSGEAGVDLLSEGVDVLTEPGGPWVFTQSKAPFSSHKAFMNRHLPPLLFIPLTAAPSLPLFFSFFFVLQTLCLSFPHPLRLSHSHTLSVTHTHQRLIDFFALIRVCVRVCLWCVFLSVPLQQHKQSLSPCSEPSWPSGKCLCCEKRDKYIQIDGKSLFMIVCSTFSPGQGCGTGVFL